MRYGVFAVLVILLAALPAGAQIPDTTPPVVSCAPPDGAWHSDDVAIPCTAEDPESGIPNPADQSFSLTTSVPAGTETSDAPTGTREVCNGATPVLCTTAGLIAGNMVDKKAPEVDCGTASGAWRATNAAIGCSAQDLGSNLADAGHASFALMTGVPHGVETNNAVTGSESVCDNVSRCTQAGPIGGNRIDRKSPRNSSRIRSTDHRTRTWSRDRRISMAFNAGSDGGSRVDGFSFSWTRGATAIPDQGKDREEGARRATSSALGNGRWFFHIRTRDRVGNWSGTAHRGPYLIDFARPRTRALAASGKVGKSLRLRYRTADNNSRTRERITVSRSGSIVASWKRRPGGARWWVVQSVRWTPRVTGTHSLCVQAWDLAGNSRRDCAHASVKAPAAAPSRCHPSYPTVCIPPAPPDLDCADVRHTDFVVRPPDPHGFDADHDGWGCES